MMFAAAGVFSLLGLIFGLAAYANRDQLREYVADWLQEVRQA